MRRLRVLHVNKLYAPWIGGVEATVQALAEEAATIPGIEVEVLTCRPRGLRRIDEINGVRVTRATSAGILLSTPMAPSFPAMLRVMRTRFDIVHVHLPFPLPMFAGWPRHAAGPRLVIHFHSALSRPIQLGVMRLLDRWNKRMFEAADRIIVTSARLQTSTSALDEFARKCVVIPLPAATSSPSQDSPSLRQAARARFGVRPGTRVVLFVGRLVYYKGLHHLLATMARLNATLLIVGEGPLRSALERQARELKLGERIRFLGRLGDDELHQAYQVADVFVLPSTHVAEAFGMVQVEAMQNGCPVINTDLPTGVPSVSIHGETGLTIPPGNPEALELALRLLLEDEELRRRLGRAGVERSALFSRRAVAAKVVELYRSLLGADCSRDVAPPTLDC